MLEPLAGYRLKIHPALTAKSRAASVTACSNLSRHKKDAVECVDASWSAHPESSRWSYPRCLTAFWFLMTAVSKGIASLARGFFFLFPQKRQRFEPKWNRQVATLVKWTIISLETAQAHTFIFGPTRSLFSLQKGCLLLGSSCKDSKLLMQAVGVCLRVWLVCISVRACT